MLSVSGQNKAGLLVVLGNKPPQLQHEPEVDVYLILFWD